jgi:hypothetical protein
MFEALKGIASFVTVVVSFLYATRIAWVCGRKCNFKVRPEDRMHALYESIPAAVLIYLFGFLVIFSLCIDGVLSIVVSSLTSSILLAGFVVSLAMPELRRRPPKGK